MYQIRGSFIFVSTPNFIHSYFQEIPPNLPATFKLLVSSPCPESEWFDDHNPPPPPHPKTNIWQWKIHLSKMYFLLNMGIFQCHVSFQGSIRFLHPKSPQAFEAVCAATMAVCKSFAPKDARPTSLPEGPMNTGPHKGWIRMWNTKATQQKGSIGEEIPDVALMFQKHFYMWNTKLLNPLHKRVRNSWCKLLPSGQLT